jgi:hypothetical protein
VRKLAEEPVIKPLPWTNRVETFDPEGTQMNFELTEEESKVWASAAYLRGHLVLSPCQATAHFTYSWNSVLSREAIVKAKRPLLLKFTRAMLEAIHFNKTSKEESKAILGKYLKTSDQEGLERAWRLYRGLSGKLVADS